MAESQPSKLVMRVRFPSPAPQIEACLPPTSDAHVGGRATPMPLTKQCHPETEPAWQRNRVCRTMEIANGVNMFERPSTSISLYETSTLGRRSPVSRLP